MDIVGAGGERTDGIFRKAEDGVQVLIEPLAHSGVKSTQDPGSSAAVSLHARHRGFPLQYICKYFDMKNYFKVLQKDLMLIHWPFVPPMF